VIIFSTTTQGLGLGHGRLDSFFEKSEVTSSAARSGGGWCYVPVSHPATLVTIVDSFSFWFPFLVSSFWFRRPKMNIVREKLETETRNRVAPCATRKLSYRSLSGRKRAGKTCSSRAGHRRCLLVDLHTQAQPSTTEFLDLVQRLAAEVLVFSISASVFWTSSRGLNVRILQAVVAAY